MLAHVPARRLLFLAVTLSLGVAHSCGGGGASSWRDRELAWRYGPTTGTASPTHRAGAGVGGKPMAEGWRLELHDGKTLSLKPYKLAAEHPLFGNAVLAIELYDKAEKSIATFVTPTLTKDGAAATFELDEATAKRAYDAVLWYRKG